MRNITDFLVLGKFLRQGSSLRDVGFGPNGIKLIKNVIDNYKKSFGCNSPEFFLKSHPGNEKQIRDEHFELNEKSRNLINSWIANKTEEPLTFIQAPNADSFNTDVCFTSFTFLSSFNGRWNFSFQDFFRTRRQFWKRLFFDPGTALNFVETDLNGATPSARIEAKIDDLSENLTVETIRLLDKSEIPKVFDQDSSFVRVVQSKSYLNSGSAAVLLTSVQERLFLKTKRLGKLKLDLLQIVCPMSIINYPSTRVLSNFL
jgi:hypothetical protein